uniref:FBA_2 domain-containing protein n=1 Tax=Caenorhabditis tropicalis TaxID=1561998 RepID=A0A1I7U4F4_9PELO
MELDEIIEFSFCSKRSRNLVKLEWKVENPTVTVYYRGFTGIGVEYSIKGVKRHVLYSVRKGKILLKNLRFIEDSYFQIAKTGPDEYTTYWETQEFGVQTLASYVTDLLGTSIHTLNISEPCDELMHAIDIVLWVMRRQGSIKTLHYKSSRDNASEMMYVLDHCKVLDNLYMGMSCNWFPEEPWITVDDLIAMDYCKIEVDWLEIVPIDLRKFLRHWVDGGSSRLRYMHLRIMQSIDAFRIEQLIWGFNAKFVRRQEEMDFLGYPFKVKDSYDLHRADGTKASLILKGPPGGFCSLYMLVWPLL